MERDFAPYECLKIDVTTCPFNPNHKIFRVHQYAIHLGRCGDKELPHVVKRIRRCPFVKGDSHVVLSEDALRYHVPRCPEHPQR